MEAVSAAAEAHADDLSMLFQLPASSLEQLGGLHPAVN
jgi:hypothetical protein